jgi:hypothetical protein
MPDFPQLIGSEKQVRWAKSIRAQKSEEWSGNLGENPLHHEMLKELLANESAAWWISYRDSNLQKVLNQTEYGIDRVKQDQEEYRKKSRSEGKKSPSLPPVTTKPQSWLPPADSGAKFMMIGPTVCTVTGKVLESEEYPF